MEGPGPATPVEEHDVRAQLARLLDSPAFAHAPSLRRFLAHLVERTLAGRAADLKEYSLGVDVFDRGEAFDPKIDTIVRAQARRLRSKLREYYEADGRSDPVIIELAKGHYVPAFSCRPPEVPATGPAARRRWAMWAAASVVALIALATAAPRWVATAHRPITLSSEYVQLTDFADSAMAPALSPDGRLVTFIRGGEAFLSKGQVYVKIVPDGEAVRLTTSGNRKFAPVFSPDGSRVTYSEISRDAGGAAAWDTLTVPVLGGEPSRLLSNATGLIWLDPRHVMFSAFKGASHLGIVTSTDARADERDIYFPAHERGMAHFSYLSPDRASVLIVEMDREGEFRSCRLVPFDGRSPGYAVGPEGSCRSAAWSPDGRWMYFGADVKGQSHLWRQAYPHGAPEQVTFGPTEEEGVAMAPDGRSLITSVGRRQSTIWIHDTSGDRALTSEGYAFGAHFARDGGLVYYLTRESPGAVTSELRSIDIASGRVARLLPGLPLAAKDEMAGRDYDVSRDGREVVYAARGRDGSSTIWLARLDLRTPPREVAKNGAFVSFGAHDDIFFVTLSNETSYFTRMNKDGSGRERIGAMSPIFARGGVSPDGEWAMLFSPPGPAGPGGTFAVPVHGGVPKRICSSLCWVWWSADGRFMSVIVFDESTPDETLVIPLAPGTLVPNVPEPGVNMPANRASIPGLQVIRGRALIGADPTVFLYVKADLVRNLYRVPLH
jgi:Tol biopolymer transport system component